MADVFISYSKHDRAVAESLADDLKTEGFDVWWDFQLYAGDDFHDMIRAEIAIAKAAVVIWSEKAVASKWVRGEAQEADDGNKLISTSAPGFDSRKVPINFRPLHCEPVVNRARIIAAILRKGVMARRPSSVPPDPLADLRARAARGEAAAQADLGYKYEMGLDGLAKDEREAVRLYKLAADQGESWGQNNLGALYADGLGGLPKDEREAARLYKLAADRGNAAGQTNLGAFYADGRGGLPKDEREAARLYKLAADQGDAWGQSNLGAFYENGQGGLPKDDGEAARLYKRAADQGNSYGQYNLARFYELGRGGLRKNEPEAARLYKLAADQGLENAEKALQRLGGLT